MEEKKATPKKSHSFAILVSLSMLIMIVAVSMIYVYTRQYNPDVLQVNAQSQSVSENIGYVNQNSPQVLENDSVQLTIKPLADSGIIIVGASVFMVVIVVSFGIVMFIEHKED